MVHLPVPRTSQVHESEINKGMPALPRRQWQTHKNFPEQVLLLDSHQNFRSINRVLIENGMQGDKLAAMESAYRRWISAMRSHENYEEKKLYPFLALRFRVSRNKGAIAEAERGHLALHKVHDRVLDAFASGKRARVLDALTAHESVLNAHLDQEEEMVIPALLALSAKEFAEYYNGRLPDLVRKLKERGF